MPPSVVTLTITESGSLVAGSECSLLCEISPTVSGLINSPTAVWTSNNSDSLVSSTGNMSTLTFLALRTSQGGSYTCVGRLVSPALTQPLEVPRTRTVIVESECTPHVHMPCKLWLVCSSFSLRVTISTSLFSDCWHTLYSDLLHHCELCCGCGCYGGCDMGSYHRYCPHLHQLHSH